VGWLSLGQLISWGSVFYLFALVMVPVEQTFGLSRTQSSLAFSLALLFEGLLAYPVGRWIDRGHERLVMTGGSLLVAVCLCLHSVVAGPIGFYATWAGLGAGMAATLYTPVFAVVTRRYPHDYRRAIITMTFLGGLASTVFIPFTAWLMAHLGWRDALLILASLHVAVVVPLHWICLKNAPGSTAHAACSAEVNPGVASNADAEQSPDTLAHHLRSLPFLLVGVFVVMTMGVTAALPTHMVTLLRESGMGERWAIAVPAAIGVAQVSGRLLLFFFERHFNVHVANRIIPCLMPLALASLLLALASNASSVQDFQHIAHPLVCLFVLLWGIGNGMLTIVKGTAIAQYVSRVHAASLNGALGLPLAISRAAAPLGLGWLWSAGAGYRNGLWALLAMGLAGVLALWLAQADEFRSTPR
jgi:MFS family permease